MTDKLTKKDQLSMSTLLDKLTIDMKITIENALTDVLLSLREEITSLKEELVISNNKVNGLENNIIEANIRSDECVQYKNDNLKIAGLLLDDDSHQNSIIALGKQLNVDILNSDISCAYNVPTKSKLTSTIVRFTRNCVRNDRYMARKDIQFFLNNKFFINEDLTLQRSKLLHALQRDDKIHRAWPYNGNICCSTK